MNIGRLIAVVFIFCCVAVAWAILGTSVMVRTETGDNLLGRQVEQLWGTEHVQRAPAVTLVGDAKQPVNGELESGVVNVNLALQHRRKGLLWYATYAVDFDGAYTFRNTLDEPVTATVAFAFPSSSAIYDDFEFRVNDVSASPQGDSALVNTIRLAPGEEATIYIAYRSRGLNRWTYRFADGITTVKDLALTVNTNFDGFDFPAGSISPTEKQQTAQGWQLTWRFTNLVSDFDVMVEMPHRINPGPLASRMSYFAPVSLLFFFAVLVILGAVKSHNLHPMHYFFLGASFFAFHLLFAYLVDHVIPEISFPIAAAVSMLLVVSYLWRVSGPRFALREAGLSQFLFLVLFSFAFFFEGYTGLVVTIGAIITLAVLMQVTARVDWAEVFRKKQVGKSASQRTEASQ